MICTATTAQVLLNTDKELNHKAKSGRILSRGHVSVTVKNLVLN